MRRAWGLLVMTVVAPATACTLALPLDGLTGAGGDDGATSDVETDTPVKDAGDGGGGGDGPSAEGPGGDASHDAAEAADADATMDASVDAPAVDVVQPDVVTGPVSCATAGVFLCEDFENGLSPTKWPGGDSLNATAVVDTTQHHRGAYALHMTSPALTTDGNLVNVAANIRHNATLPSQVFIRAFVMFSSAQPQSTEQFFVAQQIGSPYDGLQLEIGTQNGDYAMTDWTSSGLYVISTVGAAATTWNCVEWELDPPASGTTTTNSDVWVDGAEVSSLHITSTPMTDLEVLGFGIGFYQVTSLPAYDLWIDDIYVDTSRVGCTK